MASPNFFEISMQAYQRFSVLPAYDNAIQFVPLDDHGGKRPAADFLPRLHRITKNADGIALVAAVYSNYNLGIRGRREVGGIIVIDIDEPETLERIEREYGLLPTTYTTLTRPLSKPWKRHIYLLQTKHLITTFKKQVTDVTHVAGYDLKCAGGWGHVAAEGCVRDGEPIIALYDYHAPILPIPDSLVDWLHDDIKKARAIKRAQNKKKTEAEPELSPPLHYVVPRFQRNRIIMSRIRTWKNTGMSDDEIMPLITSHIRKYCEDGDAMLTPQYLRKLRSMIRKVPTLGGRAYLNLLRDRRSKPERKPLDTMRGLFLTCPPTITSSEARRFFSVHNHAEEQRMIRQLRKHGYPIAMGKGRLR